MKGVISIERKGTLYWYANIGGLRTYCRKGDKGRKLAEAARSKYVAKQYENREMTAGLRVKKVEFRTIKDLANWYMQLPTVQAKKAYYRKTNATGHLLAYFGNKPLNAAEGDDREHYRKWRESQKAACATIEFEIAVLSAMYYEARKCKKISADTLPGQFIIKGGKNPRRLITDKEFENLVEHAEIDYIDLGIFDTKNGTRRTVPVSPRLKEILALREAG